MANRIYKLETVVGTSDTSSDDAIRGALARASKTLRNLDWFEVKEIRGMIKDGGVGYFQVTVNIGFRLEDQDDD